MNTLSPNTSFQSEEFLNAFHYAQRGMGIRVQLRSLRFLYQDNKWRESIAIAHAFADQYVDKAIEFRKSFMAKRELKTESGELMDTCDEDETFGRRYILLHEMAKETDNREELRNQIIHVFLAGHDATAITIGNAIFHLCRSVRQWEKIRMEVLAAGDAQLSFESLKNMHYLQYVIKESPYSCFFSTRPLLIYDV